MDLEQLTEGEGRFLSSLFEIDPERFLGIERTYRQESGVWVTGGAVVVDGLTWEERGEYQPRLPYGWWVVPDEETYVAWIHRDPARVLALG